MNNADALEQARGRGGEGWQDQLSTYEQIDTCIFPNSTNASSSLITSSKTGDAIFRVSIPVAIESPKIFGTRSTFLRHTGHTNISTLTLLVDIKDSDEKYIFTFRNMWPLCMMVDVDDCLLVYVVRRPDDGWREQTPRERSQSTDGST